MVLKVLPFNSNICILVNFWPNVVLDLNLLELSKLIIYASKVNIHLYWLFMIEIYNIWKIWRGEKLFITGTGTGNDGS